MTSEAGQTLWHGRFESGPSEELMAYTESLSFDRAMWRDDIVGSRAHVTMLAEVGMLTVGERDSVIAALDRVEFEMGNDTFVYVASGGAATISRRPMFVSG
jgi:argininosuccinate lyase